MSFISQVAAQDNNNEGPYVFYNNDRIIVKSIVNDSLRIDSFPVSEKYNHPLTVRFTGHPDWDFSFNLHPLDTTHASSFENAERIIFFSDIEGEFEPFREMLIQNKVVDKDYNWVFGNGLLVIAGDLFDRGNEVTSYLWLLYKLEDEARLKGGAVHVILGNHEIMNLSGDNRYVQPKYFYSATLMNTGYNKLFSAHTELGRWLRSKNIIEKIGDVLIMHGGVSPAVLGMKMPVDSINTISRPWYDKSLSAELPAEVQNIFNQNDALFWYRGYFLEPRANQGLIDSTLLLYHCKKIVVGHDIVDKVTSLYEGKVVGIDVNEHEGAAQGLLMEGGDYFIIDRTGEKKLLQ
jgi:hypothetical protein